MEWVISNVRSHFFIPVGPDRPRRPADMSATICLEVYASFEIQPTLGVGEQLRKLTMTAEQLLVSSAKDIRELNGILHNSYSHHSSVHPPSRRWGCCITMFIHFGHYQTTEV